MRLLTIAVVGLGVLGATSAPTAQEVAITGELVDWVCFARDGDAGRGTDHVDCAKSCAARGQPVALVTAEGELYLLAGPVTYNDNAALIPHMGHRVEVTGELVPVVEYGNVPMITAGSVRHVGYVTEAPPAPLSRASAPMFTVRGELVDSICFYRSGADGMGPDHAECAKSCARRGQPAALVTPDGDVYMLAGEVTDDYNAALVPHMGHTIEVTGELSDVDGFPTITTNAVRHISAY